MGFWFLWFIMGLCFVAVSVFYVIPKIMLKTHGAGMPIRDRTVGRKDGKYGTVLFFEPSAKTARYIRRYRIGHDAKGPYFRGEWARKIAYACYEITVFDSSGNVVRICKVKEKFNAHPVTHLTRLPKNVDFVSLRMICVDDTPIRADRRELNSRFCFWLVALCVAMAATIDLIEWLFLSLWLRIQDNFTLYFTFPLGVWVSVLGLTAALVSVSTAIVVLAMFFLRERGKENGNE